MIHESVAIDLNNIKSTCKIKNAKLVRGDSVDKLQYVEFITCMSQLSSDIHYIKQ